ncbi:hypothetical protein ZIOFF_015371 [Zingiber officinale]|uniref:RING-type domain-containing protein n=1 Tax=Zingiber officinale TaxID=94328 RepID=A0A8J5HEU0_ZINOF|nr:hypothetical protein ZIOFF_015371 [Zingiber officinale]
MASSSALMSNAVVDAVAMEVSAGWEATANGYVIRMEARVVTRRSRYTLPPELIMHFSLRTISPNTHAVEHAHFTIQPHYILDEAAWDDETRRMLSHVAADHVRTIDLDLLLLAFRRYTRAVNDRFPIMQLSTMEFFSQIVIPPRVAHSIFTPLYYLEQQYFSQGDHIDVEPVRGLTPRAPAALVEGLQEKIVEEPGVCSICLDDFNIMTRVLEMPCRHIFHNDCLREWLTRSNTCPLCRFTLPNMQSSAVTEIDS